MSILLVFNINLGGLVSPAGWSSYDFYAVFVIRLAIRCMAFSTINTCNVFATVTSSAGPTVMLHN
jgi:hypothetical protein